MRATRRPPARRVLTSPRRVLRAVRNANDELLRASAAMSRPARAPQPRPQARTNSAGPAA